ncbi:MAG: hypothetical protein A2284_02820 [Deltaproteobacteria bacterium RIFOXYA12_FULL_61_11]|nr:MAG: hypothetical protein A2284_02820 [Deltaproteobacteria bacterium RIFOXYA12_FULL_61_11]
MTKLPAFRNTGYCVHCAHELERAWKFCPFCGRRARELGVCFDCGCELDDAWYYCPDCGWEVGASPVKDEPSDLDEDPIFAAKYRDFLDDDRDDDEYYPSAGVDNVCETCYLASHCSSDSGGSNCNDC